MIKRLPSKKVMLLPVSVTLYCAVSKSLSVCCCMPLSNIGNCTVPTSAMLILTRVDCLELSIKAVSIFAKLFLTGKIKNLVGVQIPIMKEVYKPVLKELATHGIEFTEEYSD